MQKCTDEQLKYVIEFFRDYFSVPEYSSIFLVIQSLFLKKSEIEISFFFVQKQWHLAKIVICLMNLSSIQWQLFSKKDKTWLFFYKHYPQYSKILFGLLQVRWRNICLPCQMADIFNKQTTYKVYENCLDLDVLLKIKENPHLQLINLLEKHDHFFV